MFQALPFFPSSPARRWSWLAPTLALLGMILPVTGWQAAQLQSCSAAGSSSDGGENEFPGENEESDWCDAGLEAHLLCRRWSRDGRSLRPAGTVTALDGKETTDTAHCDGDAAARRRARLPLRC